jgi:hypothetical protein
MNLQNVITNSEQLYFENGNENDESEDDFVFDEEEFANSN